MSKKAILLLIVAALAVPAVAGEMVSYKAGGDEVQGYLAVPDGKGPFPALVVIPEWWGLNGWVKENCDLFAKKGYVALGVDIYRGKSTAKPDEAHELMRGLPEDRAAADLAGAFDYLAARKDVSGDRIGTIGWCMGGGLALTFATAQPKLAACVVNYGRLVTDDGAIGRIEAPMMMVLGSTDRGIPVADAEALKAKLEKAGGSLELHVYEGRGHAFLNPNNEEGYHEGDAADVWAKTWAFLTAQLGK